MTEYTQGVCEDGEAILKDGAIMTIEEVIAELRRTEKRLALSDERVEALTALAILDNRMSKIINQQMEIKDEYIEKLEKLIEKTVDADQDSTVQE